MVRASVGHSVLLALARLRGAMDLVSFSLGLAFLSSTRRARGLACCDSRMTEGKGDGYGCASLMLYVVRLPAAYPRCILALSGRVAKGDGPCHDHRGLRRVGGSSVRAVRHRR